jgi:hypothetical protein
MKRVGITGIVLASSLAHGPSAHALTPAEIADRAKPSVVVIKTASGLGTGFVVSRDGKIATNLHVIGSAQEATVVLADKREFKDVEVMAVDDQHDLIVLRIGAKNLIPLPLGDSAKVKAGERVVAIGNPLGLDYTISDGLVSAVREVTPQLTVLQISAPISPGSSGGPLFNERGEVIGISTLIVTQGQNLNFGMPVNQLKPMLLSDKGQPLASTKPAGGPRRQVPTHDLSLLAGCPAAGIAQIATSIEDAIHIGAPLYNQGNHEACYRIYASVALDAQKKVVGCQGPKEALLAGVHRADGLKSYTDKAWAMRDAFDGLLDVIARQQNSFGAPPPTNAGLPAPPPRNVPSHPMSLLDNCSVDNIRHIGTAIGDAIEVGAPLYNQGNLEACYRVYEGAILDLTRKVPGCAGPKKALQAGLKEASTRGTYADKAWALRDAFDGLLDVIDRRLRN